MLFLSLALALAGFGGLRQALAAPRAFRPNLGSTAPEIAPLGQLRVGSMGSSSFGFGNRSMSLGTQSSSLGGTAPRMETGRDAANPVPGLAAATKEDIRAAASGEVDPAKQEQQEAAQPTGKSMETLREKERQLDEAVSGGKVPADSLKEKAGAPFGGDLASPEVRADPYPVYDQLRELDPVHWDERLSAWVLTRYADVAAVLKDKRFSSSRVQAMINRLPAEERDKSQELGRSLSLWTLFKDPPDHTRLRTLVAKAFTPKIAERLRPNVEEITRELLGKVLAKGKMDAIADFAYPLPVIVIADMLGVPREDRDMLKKWSDHLASFISGARPSPASAHNARQSLTEMTAYFQGLVEARRQAPKDDLLSHLIALEAQGEALSMDELLATSVMLIFAGHETTTNLIGNGLMLLLQHPEELERLRRDPSLIETAVEEILRYESPVHSVSRVALEPVDIGGKTIQAGQRVLLLISAANRDPAQFPESNRFDIGRQDNRHLSFGHGIHYCLGATVARVEGQIGLLIVQELMPHLMLAGGELVWRDDFGLRGLKSLDVVF